MTNITIYVAACTTYSRVREGSTSNESECNVKIALFSNILHTKNSSWCDRTYVSAY